MHRSWIKRGANLGVSDRGALMYHNAPVRLEELNELSRYELY